jgi:hypothetical protein
MVFLIPPASRFTAKVHLDIPCYLVDEGGDTYDETIQTDEYHEFFHLSPVVHRAIIARQLAGG